MEGSQEGLGDRALCEGQYWGQGAEMDRTNWGAAQTRVHILASLLASPITSLISLSVHFLIYEMGVGPCQVVKRLKSSNARKGLKATPDTQPLGQAGHQHTIFDVVVNNCGVVNYT